MSSRNLDYQSDLAACKNIDRLISAEDWHIKTGAQISGLLQRHARTAEDEQRDQFVIRSLQARLDSKWPGRNLKLQPFGSTVTGLASKSSDLDLVLLDPSRPQGRWTSSKKVQTASLIGVKMVQVKDETLPEWYDVEVLADVLGDSHLISKAQGLAKPKVPLARLCRSDGKGDVDVSVNNLFVIENTNLIKAYVDLQPRWVTGLFFAVKYWMRNRGLNDPSGRQEGLRTFPSYAIALLVIQYLQEASVLPNLQAPALLSKLPEAMHTTLRDGYEPNRPLEGVPGPVKSIRSWDVTFADPRGKHRHLFQEINTDGIRAFVEPGLFDDTEIPDDLHPWWFAWDVMKREDVAGWRNVPEPTEAAVHVTDYTEHCKCVVGNMFKSFTGWLDCTVSHNILVNINLGERAPLKSSSEESQSCNSHGCEDHRHGNRPAQPVHWQDDPFVIGDPFIICRNLAPGIKKHSKELRRLQFELARVQTMIDNLGEHFDFIKAAKPREVPDAQSQNVAFLIDALEIM